jgi:membrane protein YdbS with pleckstrin-like domain
MYFVFLLIRKSTIRKVKVKLAKISKKMMKYHIPFAITASLLIGVHAVIMAYARREDFWIWKAASGGLALFFYLVWSIKTPKGHWKEKKISLRHGICFL